MPGPATREFTGRHMLVVLVLFFGTIIAVNMTLAVYANRSWTGLVVQNSYVASQEFNKKAALGRAQSALGWKGRITYRDGRLSYSLANAEGVPVTMTSVKVTLRRPAYESEDMTVELQPESNAFSIPVAVRDGLWIIDVEADVPGRAPYRDVSRHHVTNGTLQ